MANKKDSKFVGTFLFSLCSVRVKPECYGKAAMIISTLLGIDHRVAEQMAADSGKPSLDVAVKDMIMLQLVKICLNKAGVFVEDDELDVTHYLKKNAGCLVPNLVGNDNVAKEAYYEAYKLFRSTYADMFHITVPKVDDVEDEDKIDVASFENHERETEKNGSVGKVIDALGDKLAKVISDYYKYAGNNNIDNVRNYYLYFRHRLIIMELTELNPSDPLFNLLDVKLHGSKD